MDVATNSFHAAVDELFIVGVGVIVLFCAVLTVYSCFARCSEDSRLRVPVSDAELLKQLRAADGRGHSIRDGDSNWPELCTRTDAERNTYLAFCAATNCVDGRYQHGLDISAALYCTVLYCLISLYVRRLDAYHWDGS